MKTTPKKHKTPTKPALTKFALARALGLSRTTLDRYLSQPGAPTNRVDSAEVIKIPDPIIEPITIMVASSGASPRTSLSLGASIR